MAAEQICGLLSPTSIPLIETAPVPLNLMPNPSSDFLRIGNHQIDVKSIEILSIDGQLLDANKKNDRLIDISFLPNGVYILTVNDGAIIRREKFVVSR